MNTYTFRRFSIFTLLTAALTLGVSSCKQTEDNIFDKSVNERIENQIQELRSLLISSKEGWILDYIPSREQKYGAYYIGLKFSAKDEVLATTEELKSNTRWYKSTYTIGKDKNVSLNFDTGNMAIHRYTTPDSTYAGGISLGYEGDSEFNLVRIVSKDEIQVRGKKTNNLMILRRATTSIDTFMDEIRSMKARIFNPTDMSKKHQDALVGNLGGKKQLFKLDASGLNVYTYTSEGDEKTYTASYFITPTGIRFVKPVEGITEMKWGEDKLNANGATLIARRDPSRDKYVAFLGEYTMYIGETPYDVRFEEAGYNKFRIIGDKLSYSIIADYDANRDGFTIYTQEIAKTEDGKSIRLSAMNGSNVNWGLTTGVRSSYIKNTSPKQYQMIDLGVGGFNPPANGFILWLVNPDGSNVGQYSGTHTPQWVAPLTFTRKN